MLIDTHCHLDAPEFDADRSEVATAALQAGVQLIVVPSVFQRDFQTVIDLAARHTQCVYALGIHPLFVDQSQPEDIASLADLLQQHIGSANPPVAIGEIGLDFFVQDFDRERQEYFFVEQLKLAQRLQLPVIMHTRRSSDIVLKHLRRIHPPGGIAHAFNGSRQQADILIEMGYKLGFGGAMTWQRALHLRDLAVNLPLSAIVLETDSPDIPPEWLGHRGRNTSDQLPRIAQLLADLRSITVEEVIEVTGHNAVEALPMLREPLNY